MFFEFSPDYIDLKYKSLIYHPKILAKNPFFFPGFIFSYISFADFL